MNRTQSKPKAQMPVPPSVKPEAGVQESEHTITQDPEELAEAMTSDLADIDPEAAALIDSEEAEESEMDNITDRKNVKKKPEAKVQLKNINVITIQDGVYGGERKVPGDKFTIKSEQEFSKVWMKKI